MGNEVTGRMYRSLLIKIDMAIMIELEPLLSESILIRRLSDNNKYNDYTFRLVLDKSIKKDLKK